MFRLQFIVYEYIFIRKLVRCVCVGICVFFTYKCRGTHAGLLKRGYVPVCVRVKDLSKLCCIGRVAKWRNKCMQPQFDLLLLVLFFDSSQRVWPNFCTAVPLFWRFLVSLDLNCRLARRFTFIMCLPVFLSSMRFLRSACVRLKYFGFPFFPYAAQYFAFLLYS